jgi:protocatechuate 3,4-dioxygenase beta subunit
MPSSRIRLFAVLFVCVALLFYWLLRDDRKGGDAHPAHGSQADSQESSRSGWGWLGGGSSSSQRPAEKLFALEGRVVWPDGRPAEAATVRILSRPGEGRVSFAPDRQAMSDAEGGFSLSSQRAGEYVLQAQKEDAVSPSVRVQLGEASKPVTLLLVAGASLTVTVVSAADNHPIRNATVRVQLSNDQVMQGDAYVEKHTNDAGQARIAGLDPVGNHAVWAEADGFAGKQVNIMPRDNASSAWNERIALASGSGVSGRVVDARGRGVPGALVGWCSTQETLDESSFRVFMPFSDYGRMSEQTTDADGRYRLTVQPGPGCVVAEKPGLRVGTRCQVPVSAGKETRDIDVVLLDGNSVKGRVVDATGKPVPGAEVLATTPDTIHEPSMHKAYRYRARTDAEGRFSLDGLPPMAMAVAATSAQASSALVEVDSRRPTELVLKLEYDGTLDGVVTESDGKPVAYAAVNYWVEPDYPALEAANGGKPPTVIKQFALPTNNEATVTDADGHFHVGGLQPGKYSVRATRPTATDVPPAYGGITHYQVPTGSNIRLVMPGIAAIRGRVVDQQGAPMHSFNLSLLVGASANAPDYLFPVPHHFNSLDGSFVYPNVPANSYTLRADGDDFAASRVSVAVKGTDTADAGTISVTRGQPSRPGLVVDASRVPIPRATITIETADSPTKLQLWSESDGTFRVPSVREGATIRLRADWAGGGASEWTTMTPDDHTVTLMVLTKGNGAVRGILVDNGELAGRMVVLSMPGDRPPGTGETHVRGTAQTEAGGVFTFEQIPPGSYVLWAPLGKEFARLATPVEVVEGRDANVVFNVATSPRVAQ